MKFLVALCLAFGFGFASVDINTADVASLSSLNGVGEKKAEAIVMYRKANGCFATVDELQKVKGIGEKIITKNKGELTASRCKK